MSQPRPIPVTVTHRHVNWLLSCSVIFTKAQTSLSGSVCNPAPDMNCLVCQLPIKLTTVNSFWHTQRHFCVSQVAQLESQQFPPPSTLLNLIQLSRGGETFHLQQVEVAFTYTQTDTPSIRSCYSSLHVFIQLQLIFYSNCHIVHHFIIGSAKHCAWNVHRWNCSRHNHTNTHTHT